MPWPCGHVIKRLKPLGARLGAIGMNDHHLDSTEITVSEAQAMFNRVLSSWASDLLLLRREGLAAPGWRVQVEDEDGFAWKRAA